VGERLAAASRSPSREATQLADGCTIQKIITLRNLCTGLGAKGEKRNLFLSKIGSCAAAMPLQAASSSPRKRERKKLELIV
jgi:hypothetical protein